jgi:ribose transport system ATP-binding protein
MDEPTSALSPVEVEQMFTVIAALASASPTGQRCCGVVTEFDARELTATRAAEAMVGRPVQTLFHTTDIEAGEEVPRVENLVLTPKRERSGSREPGGISLTVRRGEIVGLGGLLGFGRTELLETLYGAGSAGTIHGRILCRGKPFHPRGPRRSAQAAKKILIDCQDVLKEQTLDTQLITIDNAAAVYNEANN